MNFLCRSFAKRFGYVVVFIKILRTLGVRGFAEEPTSAASDGRSVTYDLSQQQNVLASNQIDASLDVGV